MTGIALAKIPEHVPEEKVVDFDMYAPVGLKDDVHAAWLKLQSAEHPAASGQSKTMKLLPLEWQV